jgi:hypothetical protein
MNPFRWLCEKLAFNSAEMFVLILFTAVFWGLILLRAA